MESQFPHNAVDGKVGGIHCPRLPISIFRYRWFFSIRTTGGFDEVIVFHQRFLLKPLLRQVILIIFVGGSGLPV